MEKRKRPNQNFTSKERFNNQGKSRGSDSPNWREDTSKTAYMSPSNQPPMFTQPPGGPVGPTLNAPPTSIPYQHHTPGMPPGPAYHHHPAPYHSGYQQQRIDQDHMEMVRFLNDRWLEVKREQPDHQQNSGLIQA